MEYLILFAAMIALMFFMTRGTRKRQKEMIAFRDSMEPGMRVMTASGYVGVVVSIDGDLVTLESSPGAHTSWVRAAVAKPYESVEAVAQEPATEETSSGFVVPDDVSGLITRPQDERRDDDTTK
ncbi:preprotein translocase subunit YajC [Jonesia quinghaiensis]|uniref:preprotein translocase subunit YajC n=1 Tax=Jonesia quinghaiensis TaxID=262806 RepID=UPI000424139C|nr:preprotein translocase subunit YajC [Jonesia quinghaiensis]